VKGGQCVPLPALHLHIILSSRVSGAMPPLPSIHRHNRTVTCRLPAVAALIVCLIVIGRDDWCCRQGHIRAAAHKQCHFIVRSSLKTIATSQKTRAVCITNISRLKLRATAASSTFETHSQYTAVVLCDVTASRCQYSCTNDHGSSAWYRLSASLIQRPLNAPNHKSSNFPVYSMGVKLSRENTCWGCSRIWCWESCGWVKMALPYLCCSPNITAAINWGWGMQHACSRWKSRKRLVDKPERK